MEPPCRFRSWMSSRHAFRLWKDACRLEWPLSSETSASFWSKRVGPGACPDVPSSQSLGFRVLQHEICLPLQLHLLWFCLPLFFLLALSPWLLLGQTCSFIWCRRGHLKSLQTAAQHEKRFPHRRCEIHFWKCRHQRTYGHRSVCLVSG